MNLIDVAKQFGTPEACNDFLESMRWPDGVRCVNCDSAKVSKYVKQAGTRARKNPKTGALETKAVPERILYVCRDCKRQFSVTEGTIFNDTHLSLEKWYMATALMVNAKKGVSAMQLQRDLGTAYKTAWYLSHRIRKAMGLVELADDEPLSGTVEIDETYMGSKKYDKRRKRAKYAKEPVFGIVERDGRARTYHMPEVTLKSVVEKIKDNVSIATNAVYTDESRLYGTVPGCIRNHNHETVNHAAHEWVRGDVHTGTIDGYWGLLKRGIIGSFHQISVKHLNRYRKYRKYPGRTIHRRTTRANIVNDEILAAVIGDFHDDSDVHLVTIRKKNLRFMRVEDHLLLWFKKMDRQHKPTIYPTEHARHLESGKQLSFFPDCTILIVGYLLNRDETDVVRVSISKPAGRGSKPEWFIDLEPMEDPKITVMPRGAGSKDSKPGFKVVVKKGATQDKLISS